MQHGAKRPARRLGGCGHKPLNSAAALRRVCPAIPPAEIKERRLYTAGPTQRQSIEG